MTENGLSVSSRTLRIFALMRSAVSPGSRVTEVWPAFGPRLPSPPAFETAAASFASVSHTIGPWMTGFSIPRISQILFFIILFL